MALVTGGARRIGAAIVRALHARGCRVVIHYRDSQTEALALAAELNADRPDSAACLRADLSDPVAVRRLASEARQCFGGLDLLINNASSFYPTPLAEATDQDWDALIHSNLRAPFLLSQALADDLARSGQGAILNLVDVYADKPLADHPLYCMAKAGLVMMTKSLARDLGPAVRVNGVAPGPILWPEQGGADQDAVLKASALKRAGDPQDIAGAVTWLALDAPYVTGQILAVDGGRSLALAGT
ncbi:pteridine reductase [Alloalcanivorax gelatiniphagus]|uniref:Pteridine reductase n=1 Tax=Alloalcanivorax gelatiniphagus TaxID=1194167 RepID=A0ABY2XQZ6_9GAMM|nr:pteridine reductase [Alloalcanivorax gelatiniphagus]